MSNLFEICAVEIAMTNAITKENASPFIIEQLEEALEERQTPDRRQSNEGHKDFANEDRRKQDRRDGTE